MEEREDITAAWLGKEGYLWPTQLPNGDWAALMPLMFTVAIVTDLNLYGYGDRWCYHSLEDALTALLTWAVRGAEGEPAGWHRHPKTGRRVYAGYCTWGEY